MDSRSPKLFFLPNLDDVDFDINVITESEKLASQVKSGSGVHPSPASSGSPDAEKYNADGVGVTAVPSGRPKSTIEDFARPALKVFDWVQRFFRRALDQVRDMGRQLWQNLEGKQLTLADCRRSNI
jgi:hypothetical protein